MIKASIIGATGYTGAELVRLLYRHSEVEFSVLSSRSSVGEDIADIYPGLRHCVSHTFEEQDLERIVGESDIIFICLPHGHAVEVVSNAFSAGVKVIDLGADFRLKDPFVYQKWYGLEHGAPELLKTAVYGLPEIKGEAVAQAQIIANPGCYPTSILLGLAPLLHYGVILPGSIIADSKSGVCGAGKTPSEKTHFVECNENINPYGVQGHRHRPEIEQELSLLAGDPLRISFTPHLLPITRGILSTIYADLGAELSEEQVREMYREYYSGKGFIRLLPPQVWPHTKWVYGSNFCDINFCLDQEAGRITVMSAIDNLVKGASGQAVQNMNLMFGFDERTALESPGLSI